MERDPVCGMQVNPNQATAKSDFRGETYYFCCSNCKSRFDMDPQAFVSHQEMGQQRSSIRDE